MNWSWLKTSRECGMLAAFCIAQKGWECMFFRMMMFVWEFVLDLVAVTL
jgi:hypothetical protein